MPAIFSKGVEGSGLSLLQPKPENTKIRTENTLFIWLVLARFDY